MYVCHCEVVSDAAIRDAIACGALDVCEVTDVCGAGGRCGACVPTIEMLLEEAARQVAGARSRRGAEVAA